MAETVWGLTDEQHRETLELLRERRSQTRVDEAASLPDPRDEVNPVICAILLDDLDSYTSVPAELMRRQSLNASQTLTAYGAPTGGYFKIGFKASSTAATEWTGNFYPLVDGPSRMKTLLEAIPSIGKGNVVVSLGTKTLPSNNVSYLLWRWNITFIGRFIGATIQPLQVDSHLTNAGLLIRSTNRIEPTGEIKDIFCTFEVGEPTPLKAGAVIHAHWIEEFDSYCVCAAEPRDRGSYGLFS